MESNQLESQPQALTGASAFQFACHENLPCFTQCCRDVNIYLTPYDVLRIKRALKISSAELLNEYTLQFIAKGTNIPIIMLEMDPATLRCKFVTDAGCKVYENRPWACRLYPLDLGNRAGEYAFIVSNDRCKGFNESRTWTVQEWLDNQGVARYMEMEKFFHAIMPAAFGFKPGSEMDPSIGRLIFHAYDLDRFATLLDDKGFQKLYDLDEESIRRIRENDEEMLLLAFRYIRTQIEQILGME